MPLDDFGVLIRKRPSINHTANYAVQDRARPTAFSQTCDIERMQLREFNSGEFKGHISVTVKSRQLFHSQFCMWFSGMGFYTKVF